MREQEPDVGSSGQNPSFSRLRALADTICRRAFEKTAAQLQRSKRQGQELVTQIPGVSPLVSSKQYSSVSLSFQQVQNVASVLSTCFLLKCLKCTTLHRAHSKLRALVLETTVVHTARSISTLSTPNYYTLQIQ